MKESENHFPMKDPATVSWGRILKCGISLGAYSFTVAYEFLIRILGGKPKGSCVILNYHSIPLEERAKFARQLDIVVRRATPIAIDMETMPAPGVRSVGITFDDGFENFISQAFPELERRNIPSTVFVILDALGNEFGTPDLLERVMSPEQLRAIPENRVTFGSHTLTHPFLPSLQEQDAFKELLESRVQLEKMLNRRVVLFSFPFGGFTEALVRLCHQAGYDRVFTTLPYLAFANAKEFAVGRIRVDTTDWPLEFRLKIAGAYRWLPWAFAFKKRLLNSRIAASALGSRHKESAGQRVPHSLIRKSASDLTA